MITGLDVATSTPIACDCGTEIQRGELVALLGLAEQHPMLRSMCLECARIRILSWRSLSERDTDPAPIATNLDELE